MERCRCLLLGAACLARKDSEKTNNTLIFLSLSLMRDSLTVLSESTEYPLCKKQAIQTKYMITHCLEGIQGPSCACINSSWSATVNLANAKKPLWNEACQALKRIPAFLCLAALNIREMFPVRPKQHLGTWAVLPRVAGEEEPCSDLVPAADRTGKGGTVQVSEVPLQKSPPRRHSHSWEWWPEPLPLHVR